MMRVVIVGAGICGLVAGRRLADSDVDVVLVDKGRSVGGRLATRRIGDATVDHGARSTTGSIEGSRRSGRTGSRPATATLAMSPPPA
jgi:predicted NAD/FAD-dependent oxidoreductase